MQNGTLREYMIKKTAHKNMLEKYVYGEQDYIFAF